MGQSKLRKQLNKVLVNYVNRVQPLFEEYEEQCSGSRNKYVEQRAKQLLSKISAAKELALDEAEEVYEGYLNRLDKKAKSISGTDIDKADIILLESTLYTLNQEEFDVLQDKYEGNRSMERILAGYAEKRGNPVGNKNGQPDLKSMLVCRFMSDDEKRNLAKRLYGECVSWINNDNGNGIADYVLSMAGDMFGAADKLKE